MVGASGRGRRDRTRAPPAESARRACTSSSSMAIRWPTERTYPALVDRAAVCATTLRATALHMALTPAVRRQAAAEIAAQFEAFRATGLPLDHVNAHRHLHLHPIVAARSCASGDATACAALRVPVEPWRIVAEIDPQTERPIGRVRAPWAAWLRRHARRAGLTTADAVFGLAWSGAMTARRLAAMLGRLPVGHCGNLSAPRERTVSPAPRLAIATPRNSRLSATRTASLRRSARAMRWAGMRTHVNDSRVAARGAAPPRRESEIAWRVVPARRGGLAQRFRLPSRYPAARNQSIASARACR